MPSLKPHASRRRYTCRLLWILIPLLAAAFTACSGRNTELLWDTWGVPHIFARNSEELFGAFGWAQMQSHGDLILRLYGQARGRAAEYWGEEYLKSDQWVRTMGVPSRSGEWLDAQKPEFRGYLEAFAEGINAYAKEHPDRIADEVEVVLPVSARDVLAHAHRVIHFVFVTSPRSLGTAREALASQNGSNAWAVGPKRSENGHAMLVANPHLPWADLFLFYEAQLTGPGIDAYGATLVGIPFLGIAFNDSVGWTHTVNTHDGEDHFELTLKEGGYEWDGSVQAFETEEHTLKVKQDDGSFQEEKLTVRSSVHGPVIAQKGGKALALRVVGLDQPNMLEQWWNMARATNLKEFETALSALQIPMFTVMYADRDGHILHLFGGQTPVRPEGDFPWSRIVPGDTSKTLWTTFHPYEELPRVLDPLSGWLQNANDPPWTTTFPPALNPDDFPAYMAPRFMHFRAQRSARMPAEDENISFAELIAYKHSTRMELADRILDDLIPAARRRGGPRARRAADVLEAWDRQADNESRGAVLFAAFFDELRQRMPEPFAVAWKESSPRTTPDELADPAAAVAALAAAFTQVEKNHGAADVAWGDVYRLRIDGVDLPANGGPNSLGIFRSLGFRQDEDGRDNDRRYRARSGDSYVAVIEFSNPVRARALLSYGNASQPGSSHRTDQLPLFSRKELRPVWRAREEIEAHLEGKKVF